jgi:cysteinyl-tRNA synthetase
MFLYNTLHRKKEEFVPIAPPHVGLYVCGPTVYGDAHLGHARSAITFDLLFRTLKDLGYKVRYVRNITDVGHLEHDADEGEDKVAKKARLAQLEPMEIAQFYINRYHDAMRTLGVLPPSIEPQASGHIPEQIEVVKSILDHGFAYEKNGSVYFDVESYSKKHDYGILSGRVPEQMQTGSRQLDGQGDKRSPFDFALWKKASPEHIMRWSSPWSVGFPGWHLECSAMSHKYLGKEFDIHGGGMDLIFPHHEGEIAQNTACCGSASARYWVHNNMITIGGQKMAKSLGNFITLDQLFTGDHAMLAQAYSPMTIRFFILQAHYRSTLDFSNEALQAAEKGLERLMKAVRLLDKIKPAAASTVRVGEFDEAWREAIADDLNSPIAISVLFDQVRVINSLHEGQQTIAAEDLETLKKSVRELVCDVLGLRDEQSGDNTDRIAGLIEMILQVRRQAKADKDWASADRIRDGLAKLGVLVKDRKDGTDWELE